MERVCVRLPLCACLCALASVRLPLCACLCALTFMRSNCSAPTGSSVSAARAAAAARGISTCNGMGHLNENAISSNQIPYHPAITCHILPPHAISCHCMPYPAIACRILPSHVSSHRGATCQWSWHPSRAPSAPERTRSRRLAPQRERCLIPFAAFRKYSAANTGMLRNRSAGSIKYLGAFMIVSLANLYCA